MRRTTFDKLLGWIGTSLGVLLLIVATLVLWASAYIHNNVQNQLSAQKITFPRGSGVRTPDRDRRDHAVDDPLREPVRGPAAPHRPAG